MAVVKLNIDEFLSMASQHPVLDVRSPSEFLRAHLPGAYSLPLFSDEERKVVGTTYKKQSREAAIKIGLDYFGLKMKKMIETVEQVTGVRVESHESNLKPKISSNSESHRDDKEGQTVLVYCWRGGMRSAGVAWLLDLYGFRVYTLSGGYKSFRGWVLNSLQQEWNFKILGGYTGSGKTKALNKLEESGESVIDLEALANHKGSAFGALGTPQPSQEMFENLLASKLFEKTNGNFELAHPLADSPSVWIEDESQRIGRLNVPQAIWERMRTQPVFFLDIPFKERLNFLIEEYGKLDKGDLASGITRIHKRLGGLESKTALNCLIDGDIPGCFSILLKYYDKLYWKGLQNRTNLEALLTKIECDKVDENCNTEKLIKSNQVA